MPIVVQRLKRPKGKEFRESSGYVEVLHKRQVVDSVVGQLYRVCSALRNTCRSNVMCKSPTNVEPMLPRSVPSLPREITVMSMEGEVNITLPAYPLPR